MKKLVLALLFSAFLMTGVAQKWRENKIQYFVDAIAKEYSLSKDQVKILHKERTAYIMGSAEVSKQAKNGDISQEVKKEKLQALNKEFSRILCEVTGKTRKELNPVLVRLKEELKNVK